jgi:membrane protease YdiL (CAAX protease family)
MINRWLIVVALVAAWMLCGFVGKLSADAYLLFGIPLVAGFQLAVARRPLRSMWLRAAPPFRLGARGIALTVFLAIAPVCGLAASLGAHRGAVVAAWYLCAIAGCAAVAYAWINQPRTALWPALGFAGLALLCGLLTMGTAAIATGRTPWIVATRLPSFALDFLLYLPVTFVLEEVVFRGALDSYVGGTGIAGWRNTATAIGVAALWGLWHLPIMPDPLQLRVVVQLLAVHVPVGVFLALSWRAGGTLLWPALAHALIDAYRNAVLG